MLDAGCGSGRVTRKLLDRLPEGRVVAVDGAPSMVAEARAALGDERATVIQSDLLELELDEPVDAVLSSAVFHWIPDHDALFARLYARARPRRPDRRPVRRRGQHRRLPPPGRRGRGARAVRALLAAGPGRGTTPSAEVTAERLERAGFTEIETWLQPWDVTPPESATYLRTVCLHPHTERLPEELRDAYIADVLAATGDPVLLDYVRLNIDARRPPK